MPETPDIEEIPTREAVAKREIGVTTISPRLAAALVAFFLLTIGGVPVVQVAYEAATGQARQSVLGIWPVLPEAWQVLRETTGVSGVNQAIFAANGTMLRGMGAFEDTLEERFFGAERWLPYMQAFYLEWLGVGNEQVYPGRDGWLFYRPDVDYVTGRGFLNPRVLTARSRSGDATVGDALQPDPIPAITAFHAALAKRDIHLVVVPTPVKPSVEPALLSARYEGRDRHALHNLSFHDWVDRLRAAGVDVFMPGDALVTYREKSGQPAYLSTDTHWTPSAMESIAEHLARHLKETGHHGAAPQTGLQREAVEIVGRGDIAAMLNLPATTKLFPGERVTIHQVRGADGAPLRFDPASEVLLLGDSFSNIFSLEALGWGTAAGLGEQLSYFLGRPIAAILRNDAGSFATREILVREMARGQDRLAGKRVVVWQFAERELALGDWKILPLPEVAPSANQATVVSSGTTPDAGFLVLDPATEPVRVRGRIAAASPVPRPGTVPYRDHVMAVHLVEIEGTGLAQNSQAVVYLFGMRDNVQTAAAAWQPGDRVALDLRAWEDVAPEYERFNRSELDDEKFQLEIPAWGELPPNAKP